MLTVLDFKWLFYLDLDGSRTRDQLMIAASMFTGKRAYNKLPSLLKRRLVIWDNALASRTEVATYGLTSAGRKALDHE